MAKTRRRNLVNTTQSSNLSHSDPNRATPNRNPIIAPAASLSVRSVFLYDWWLVKAEPKGFAVAGFSTREKVGAREFCSAVIAKRHHGNALETIDGIVIHICGFINESRTQQNGIPYDIYYHFRMGFPHSWEEYATKSYGKESANNDVPMKKSGLNENTSLPISLDDINNLPATVIRDRLVLGDPLGCTLDDLLGQLCGNAPKDSSRSACSEFENQNPVKTTNPVLYETPRNCKKARADQKFRDVDGILQADDKVEEFTTPRIGVVTRSMSRLRNLSSTSTSECKKFK